MSATSGRKRTPLEIQRAVVFALFVRELKGRFGGSWTGAFWVVFDPLANVLIIMALFGQAHQAVSTLDYPVFLVTGMLPYFIFKGLMFRLMDGIDANRGLFAYRQVKPMDTLISRTLLELVVQSAVYVSALGLLAWLGHKVLPAQPLELIGVSLLLIVLGFALGLLLAVATHGAPRARTFIRLCSTPLYMASGVIFPVHALPPDLLWWLSWNPALHLVELSRSCFFPAYTTLPSISVGYVASIAVVVLAVGLSLYRVRRQQLISES